MFDTKIANDLTVFILTTDKRLLSYCMAALQRGTLQPGTVTLIENVTPLDKAMQLQNELCQTEFYFTLDEDVELTPDGLEKMYTTIKNSSAKMFSAQAHYSDKWWGAQICCARIYRTALAQKFPYKRATGCDWCQWEEAKKAGYDWVRMPGIVGAHAYRHNAEQIYSRMFYWMLKTRERGFFGKPEEFLARMINRMRENKTDEKGIAAFAGAFMGASVPLDEWNAERDASKYDTAQRQLLLTAFHTEEKN